MNHYSKLAKKYDDYYHYSKQYFNYFLKVIIEGLEIKRSDRIIDIGSGTGMFANAIKNQFPSCAVSCVDKSIEMLDANDYGNVRKVCLDALDFVKEKISYEKIFMKEFIHHLNEVGRHDFLKGVYSQLVLGGTVLILVEPKRLDYPLFESALNNFEDNQPSHKEIIFELEDLSFIVSHSIVEHSIVIKKAKYLEMVRDRYMSVLSEYSDIELENGINEIDLKYGDTIVYKEIFYCIKGVK